MPQTEHWARLSRYPSYEISTCGRLRDRLTKSFLKPLLSNGYPTVCLVRGRRTATERVHRLVLETFSGAHPELVGRHFPDPTPANCSVSNLRWGTHADNARDSRRTTRKERILWLRGRHPRWSLAELGKAVGSSKQYVYEVLRNAGLSTKAPVKCPHCGWHF